MKNIKYGENSKSSYSMGIYDSNYSESYDIANELNRYGKNGWECFHVNMTAYGTAAVFKRIDYNAMETKRLKSIAKVTNTTIDEVMKSELFNKINKEYKK